MTKQKNKKLLKAFLNHLLWFIVAFAFLIGIETALVSLLTGFTPNYFSFVLFDKIQILFQYFLEEPIETLSFILIDKPIFKIDALQENPTTVIWGLHYYAVTIVTHIIIAFLASRAINTHRLSKSALLSLPIKGITLLLLSSLFLYLSSCCSAGANWIIHTWILAVVFNPVTASQTLLELYNYIHDGLIYLQYLMGITGAYLIYLKSKNATGNESKSEHNGFIC